MKNFHSSIFRVLVWIVGGLLAAPAYANLPGGGNGTGANVTLVDGGSTVTINNGIVSITFTKSSAQISTINYTFNNTGSSQTINVVAGNPNTGKLYWENSNNQGCVFTYALVADPASNGGNYAEVALTTTTVAGITMEVHYSMLRGSTGFYCAVVWRHSASDAAFSFGECRDNIYAGSIFNWMSVDDARNRLMAVSGGSAIGVDNAPVEVSLWTNGLYAGQYEDKYCYAADLGTQHVWGWSSVGTGGKNIGLWNVSASSEYYNGGPMKRELTEHIGTTILNMINGGHYGGGSDGSLAAGEVWSKVSGPYLIYCNNITNSITGTNAPAQALYADAKAQAIAEAGAWPYSWFTNASYALAALRGTVSGQLVINDSGNPNALESNVWVGVIQQPSTTANVYDFQQWMKPYQFWVKTDANGNFTIPDVIAGVNYTLFAFGPGAAGTFQSQALVGGNSPNTEDIPAAPFSVTVTGGATNNLGPVTWTPARVGQTVFEIGYPNRTGDKFRHGDDYWVGDIGPATNMPSPIWSKHLEYPIDFPSEPNYIVGQSRWSTDWNYVQPALNVTDSVGTNFNGTSSTITFNLPAAPTNGAQASLYIALSSDYQGPMIVKVNGTSVAGSTGYFPNYNSSGNGSDSTIRQANHGIFSDVRTNFSSTLLHAGQNTITLNMRKGGYFANHAMYDYIRLELTGYTPPAPANCVAYAGNAGNLISWPVTPGATSYTVLRSTTSGGGYVSITNGVVGPVCGSGANHAMYLDASAVNGTTYYYVVRSVNPNGSSTNSPSSAAATPSAGLSVSVPAPPTGLTVMSAAHQSVTLNWTAVAGANFYSIWRSTVVNNGGGGTNVLSTILLNNTNTSTSYTDTALSDGSIYSYAVTATSAGGTSGNSLATLARPLPASPSSAPALVIAAWFQTNNIYLNWSAVSGAVGYVIQRATSTNGAYSLLGSITWLGFVDNAINTNTTYYYKITAMNAGGTSSSLLVATRPGAPGGLTATAGNAQVVLTWPASVGATGYIVQRGNSSGNATNLVASSLTTTNFIDSGLTNGVTYYYIVKAIGVVANSGNSLEASATPFLPAPPVIGKFSIVGTNFSLMGTGGVANSTYYVIYSTNVARPLINWTRLLTNQFDSSGNFNFTNPINPNFPQTFYKLQLP